MKIWMTLLAIIFNLAILTAQLGLDVSFGVSLSNVEYENDTYEVDFDILTHGYLDVETFYMFSQSLGIGLINQLDFRGYRSQGRTELKYRRLYWDLMPIVIYKPLKSLKLSIGGYYGTLLRDEYQGVEGSYVDISHLHITKDRDRGMLASIQYSYGKIGLRILYKHGTKNIDDRFIHSINGVSIGDVAHKTRELQVGVVYQILPI